MFVKTCKIFKPEGPVPIQILYLTAWVDAEGSLRFAPDVYEFDPGQQAALDRFSKVAKC
jgi:murein L,D-transpeptidase YcbB/YkuD